jgi:hypothetical protein
MSGIYQYGNLVVGCWWLGANDRLSISKGAKNTTTYAEAFCTKSDYVELSDINLNTHTEFMNYCSEFVLKSKPTAKQFLEKMDIAILS